MIEKCGSLMIDFARQLETELAEAKEALAYIVETDKIMRPEIRHVHAEKVLNGEKFDTAKELAAKILLADHAARVLPELVEALESLADKNGEFHNWENGDGESLDKKLNDALSHAKNAQDA